MTDQASNALHGLRVLVTRAAHQADDTANELRSLGAQVISLPMIEITEPESWESFDSAVAQIQSWDWIVFASANAVDSFFARAPKLTHYPKFASIGPKTTAALNRHGQRASFEASVFIAESFVERFPITQGTRVLWPKTNIGRTVISEELTSRGAFVEIVHCYKTALPSDSPRIARELKQLLADRAIDVVIFASSETARNFDRIMESESIPRESLANVRLMAIGPETAKAMRTHLGKCDLQPENYTIEGVIACLVQAVQAR